MPKSNVKSLATSPLALLRLIRDAMAQAASAQLRLDHVVRLIASGFSSEVCSVYLLRAGDIFELFASQGLKASSVHATRLTVGQGLVGEIAATAEPLNLAHAENHPKFEYRPETGEEIYSSFVGVPILQGGKVIGVLVVQSKEAREYSADQVEVLQTVAMVMSELAISGQLVAAQEIATATGGLVAQQLSGIRLSAGMAKAPAVLHERKIVITQYVASDMQHERERFAVALRSLQESFDRHMQDAKMEEGDEKRELIETYLLFTQDRGWLSRIDEAIGSGLTAEAGVKKVQEELRAKMSQLASPYIKERIQDLEDLSNHLLQVLLGKELTPSALELPDEFILVARTLGPAELLNYDHKRIKGLIIEEGSTTSHTAVIARAMDIPAMAKVDKAASIIQPGDMVILDAEAGNIFVRPSDEVEAAMDKHIRQFSAREMTYASLRALPAVSTDGTNINLNVNAGLFVDAASVMQEGVAGIGLYRTELPYMTASSFPGVETQVQLYSSIIAQLPDKRIIFRSFDIGGDKKVPYLHAGEEENPAMGWRATRIGIDRPGILLTQIRALLTASSGKPLHIMFPFIAEVGEFDKVKAMVERACEAMKKRGETLPTDIKLGIMVEIPSILWQLDAILPKLDFISIGSNDLMQFLFAVDRGAPHMADSYDTLSPVMLKVVQGVVQKAAQYHVEVSFCGEMARRPLDALALISVGVRNLSVSASALGAIKAMVRSVNLAESSNYVEYLLANHHPSSIRSWLASYARDHGVIV